MRASDDEMAACEACGRMDGDGAAGSLAGPFGRATVVKLGRAHFGVVYAPSDARHALEMAPTYATLDGARWYAAGLVSGSVAPAPRLSLYIDRPEAPDTLSDVACEDCGRTVFGEACTCEAEVEQDEDRCPARGELVW